MPLAQTRAVMKGMHANALSAGIITATQVRRVTCRYRRVPLL
jgi:hypothetical protein